MGDAKRACATCGHSSVACVTCVITHHARFQGSTLLLQDLSLMKSFQTSLPALTAATQLPGTGLLAFGTYSQSMYLWDVNMSRPAGSLDNITSTAAMSLTAWPGPSVSAARDGASVLAQAAGGTQADGSCTSRSTADLCSDFLAVGDADGSVRLLQLDTTDSVSSALAGPGSSSIELCPESAASILLGVAQSWATMTNHWSRLRVYSEWCSPAHIP